MPRKNILQLSLKIEAPSGALKHDFLAKTAPHVREWSAEMNNGLHFGDERYGKGGTATVYKGSFIGENVAVKVTPIDEGLFHNYIDRIDIFNQLKGINAVLLPISTFIRSGANTSGVENESLELLEVYPACEKYEFPRTQREFLDHLIFLLDGILKMHSRSVAHLDFKIPNLLYYRSPSGIASPVISDLGESRIFRQSFSIKAEQISTSVNLIIENIWVKALCKNPILYLNSHIEIQTIKYLLMNHTPQCFYPIIDSLMIGIVLADVWQKPFLNRKIHYGFLSTDISQCGKELLVGSLFSLYRHWELSAKGRTMTLFEAFDPSRLGLTDLPNTYSIRNLRDLYYFLDGVLGHKRKIPQV